MDITISIHVRIPKRSSAPVVVSAIAHLASHSLNQEPRVVIPLNPRPGCTSDDVFCRILPLQRTPIRLDVPAWFFDLERQKDAQELVLEAVREATRQAKRQRA